MNKTDYISPENLEILKQARENYGYKNQISVATEELCELASVLSKYPRYEQHRTASVKLYNAVIDEVADVFIVLDHVTNIFSLLDEDIQERIRLKIDRLKRWMETNPSFEHTTVDREVIVGEGEESLPIKVCQDCIFVSKADWEEPCVCCSNHSKFERKAFPNSNKPQGATCDDCKRASDDCGVCAPCTGFESLLQTPDEISQQIYNLCNFCRKECDDTTLVCVKREKRKFLDAELDRALSRL